MRRARYRIRRQFLESIIDVVQQVPNELGQGVFWWYPEARPVTGLSVWEGGRYGLFDQNGNLLPAASEFTAVAPTMPGDDNKDGKVDAADYVVWRKTAGTEAAYNAWRTHFGTSNTSTGSGGGSTGALPSEAAVPEPAALIATGLFVAAILLSEAGTRRLR